MEGNNDRALYRFQWGNALPVKFSLFDKCTNLTTGYCICTDLSETGARFFTDCEFQLNQLLQLSIEHNGQQETVDVIVIRVDSGLSDEERYCAAVKFEKPLVMFQQLSKMGREVSQSIAA